MKCSQRTGKKRNSARVDEKSLYLKVMMKWTDMVWAYLNWQQHKKGMQKKIWLLASIPWEIHLTSVMVVRREKKKSKKKLIQKSPLKWALSLRHMKPLFPFPQHSTQMCCSSQSGISKRYQIERLQSKMTSKIWEQKIQKKRDYLVREERKTERVAAIFKYRRTMKKQKPITAIRNI